MYWYKLRYFKFLVSVILLPAMLASCKPDDSGVAGKKFFDLKGYFEKDAARLKKTGPLINKTVVYNSVPETKKVRISDWSAELDLFTESDINKPAWRESYTITSTPDFLIYKATDPALRTREIMIKRADNKIKWILIFNHNKNILYETVEKLTYYPDSLYLIQKKQHVKLIGTNTYRIQGIF